MNNHIVIRADGGPDIGYGHLVRTGALAEHALAAGDRVTYATRTPEHAREVCPDNIEIVELGRKNDHRDLSNWITNSSPDAVLTDSYDIDTQHQQLLAERVPYFAVVLDDTRFAICADVLINGNIYAQNLDYEWVGPEPEWCLGTDYLLLREEIRSLADQDPPFRETAERALITMGGSDIRNTTPDVVRAFDGIDIQVDVIVGPGFENRKAIDRAVARTDATFDVVENPDDLPKRMFEADLAVSATGSTIYELLALGTPTIGLPQANNQKLIAEALDDRDTLVALNGSESEELSEAIRSLAGDVDRRRTLHDRGEKLVDGEGVERVYKVITRGNS